MINIPYILSPNIRSESDIEEDLNKLVIKYYNLKYLPRKKKKRVKKEILLDYSILKWELNNLTITNFKT